ncbi:hypothetical protein [Saccharibacillus brassicae]|uniref:Uncharacterized protein n=1 Tax=Saccharibacillus brassicae TaxID=2583377 RepID=A0A4Y6UVN5_SACBS|nr:hypothetical protein [Saccharibacillus brassicae]QDH21773.1 hypothetical protein FFV09_13505 [Saccharibacillus brassicae]
MTDEQKKFIVSYGVDLDHNNMEFLTESLLTPYLDDIFFRKNKKASKEEARAIVQIQTMDLNPRKPSYTYYTNEYYVTVAQLEGFKYGLSKLKGKHVLCDPDVQGHFWSKKGEIEFSFNLYCTLEGSYLLFYQFGEDFLADELILKSIHRFPESKRYLEFSKDVSKEERKRLIENWIEAMTNLT